MPITIEDLMTKDTTDNRAAQGSDSRMSGVPTMDEFLSRSRMDMPGQAPMQPMQTGMPANNMFPQQQIFDPQPRAQQNFGVGAPQMTRPDLGNYGAGLGGAQNFGILDNNTRLTSQNAIPEQGQAFFDNSQSILRPATQYDYTVADAANATGNVNADDLDRRLSHSTGVQEYGANADEFFSAAQRNRDEQQRQQRRINTKGKIIIGLYAAVVAVVIALIIANAAKINKGEAVTPTSSVEIVQEDADL